MILTLETSPHRHGGPTGTVAPDAPKPVPDWLRRAVRDAQDLGGQGLRSKAFEDVALAAGAAIGALDTVVRGHESGAGAWRQRLALTAAAEAAKRAGRSEDEAALRDAVLLARAGDASTSGAPNPGPAGRLALTWRRLVTRPAEELLTGRNLAALLEEFGYAGDDEAAYDLCAELRQLGTGGGLAGTLAGAFAAAERYGFGSLLGPWLADALLAQRLGWSHAVPLLGTDAAWRTGRPRRPATASDLGTEADPARDLLAAQARAALRAVDLAADLRRRADRLLAAAPKLRARGADAIVGRLLDEDALVAARGDRTTDMSDRALRRLFDRLVQLGAVRELSGRAAFRIYGL